VIGGNAALMEELYLLRELCATQDEKYKDRLGQLDQERLSLRGQIDYLQSVIRESEDNKTKLNKKVAEKAQAQKQMRYRLLLSFDNITSSH
jgi:predicted secreted protein